MFICFKQLSEKDLDIHFFFLNKPLLLRFVRFQSGQFRVFVKIFEKSVRIVVVTRHFSCCLYFA